PCQLIAPALTCPTSCQVSCMTCRNCTLVMSRRGTRLGQRRGMRWSCAALIGNFWPLKWKRLVSPRRRLVGSPLLTFSWYGAFLIFQTNAKPSLMRRIVVGGASTACIVPARFCWSFCDRIHFGSLLKTTLVAWRDQ